MINHGLELDVNPSKRYRFNSMNRNWNRVLQHPTVLDADRSICFPTVEFAVSPVSGDDWLSVGQIRIVKHWTPYSPMDKFTDAVPKEVWDKLGEVLGERKRHEIVYFNHFMSLIDWDKYENLLMDNPSWNTQGIPFTYVRDMSKWDDDADGAEVTFEETPRFLRGR